MLDATGGDAAALAEIAAACTLNGTRQSPTCSPPFAWHGTATSSPTATPTSPPRLPAAWAALGQPIRAEALARSITGPGQQAQALASLARVRGGVRGGPGDRAEALARSITDLYHQTQALASLARVTAGAGDLDRARALAARAEQIALSITDPHSRRRPWPAWPR